MTRSKIVTPLLLCMVCFTAVSSAGTGTGIVPLEHGYVNEEALLRYIRPMLQSSGAAARINYHADCQADNDYPIPFPKLLLGKSKAGAKDVSDIWYALRNNKQILVTETEPGLVHISIGRAPEALLQTKISSLVLKPTEQYDVQSAFRAVEDSVEFQLSLRKFGMRGVPRPYNLPVQSPVRGLPHLPASFANITVDRVLDTIAKTFGVIVVVGYCETPPTYDLTYTGVKEW